jgi:hypothetical protein
MNPDFTTMTKVELRAYVIANPRDRTAFYTFVDRFTANASPETFALPQSPDEFEQVAKLVQQKVEQMKKK